MSDFVYYTNIPARVMRLIHNQSCVRLYSLGCFVPIFKVPEIRFSPSSLCQIISQLRGRRRQDWLAELSKVVTHLCQTVTSIKVLKVCSSPAEEQLFLYLYQHSILVRIHSVVNSINKYDGRYRAKTLIQSNRLTILHNTTIV